jgi:hypothetical protein
MSSGQGKRRCGRATKGLVVPGVVAVVAGMASFCAALRSLLVDLVSQSDASIGL